MMRPNWQRLSEFVPEIGRGPIRGRPNDPPLSIMPVFGNWRQRAVAGDWIQPAVFGTNDCQRRRKMPARWA